MKAYNKIRKTTEGLRTGNSLRNIGGVVFRFLRVDNISKIDWYRIRFGIESYYLVAYTIEHEYSPVRWYFFISTLIRFLQKMAGWYKKMNNNNNDVYRRQSFSLQIDNCTWSLFPYEIQNRILLGTKTVSHHFN